MVKKPAVTSSQVGSSGLKLGRRMGLFVAGYVLIFLVMRLTNLALLPVFGDEVLHIVWVKATLAGDWWIGLREGLRPIYIWLVALAVQFWPNTLITARVVSVLSGLVGGVICYQLAEAMYPGRQIGFGAALFYLFSPFALFYDRLGLVDTLLTTLMGATLLLSLYLWRYPSLIKAISLGGVFAVAALTKINAVLYYMMPILLWIFWGHLSNWRKTVMLLAIVYGVPLLAAGIPLLTQPIYGVYLAQFTIATPAQVSFTDRVGHNLMLTIEWLNAYLSLPFIILLILGLFLILIKRDIPGLILTCTVIGTILFFVGLFKGWYPRYLLPMIIPLSVIFAGTIGHLADLAGALIRKLDHQKLTSLSRPVLSGVILLVLSIPSLFFDYLIITTPVSAPWPAIEKLQYFEGPYSGYGLPESAQVIQQLAAESAGVTLLSGPHSLDAIGASLYLPKSENFSVEILTDFDKDLLGHINALAQNRPVLTVGTFAVDQDDTFMSVGAIKCYQIEQLASFSKPGGKVKVNVYQWLFSRSYCEF